MTWPVSEIDIVNQALILTANNPVNVANDGSDEWTVADAAYQKAVEYMLDSHNWQSITRVRTLTRLTSPRADNTPLPQDDQFDSAYAKPPDCIHLIWVRLNDQPVVYTITGSNIELSAIGGSSISNPPPPNATPGIVTIKYVSSDPFGDQSAATNYLLRTFFTSLETFVEAGCYRGLNEDIASADRQEQKAMVALQEARARSDQEMGKRAPFNSRWSASRRVRRPFPPVPTGWGGTGIPG